MMATSRSKRPIVMCFVWDGQADPSATWNIIVVAWAWPVLSEAACECYFFGQKRAVNTAWPSKLGGQFSLHDSSVGCSCLKFAQFGNYASAGVKCLFNSISFQIQKIMICLNTSRIILGRVWSAHCRAFSLKSS